MITNSKKEKLLDIIFGDIMKSQYDTENLCKKASLKLCPVLCVTPFADLSEKTILFNVFFQFTGVPL